MLVPNKPTGWVSKYGTLYTNINKDSGTCQTRDIGLTHWNSTATKLEIAEIIGRKGKNQV